MSNKYETQGTIQVAFDLPENAGVSLLVVTDLGGVYPFNIHKQKYIPNPAGQGEYVDDEETYNKALELLVSLGATSFETAKDELTGKRIEKLYQNGEYVSFEPIKEFVKYQKITAADKRRLSKDAQELRTFYPMSENKRFPRFNLGFGTDLTDEDGNQKNFTISRIKFESDKGERSIGLKFENRQTRQLQEQIDKGQMPEAILEAVKESQRKLVEVAKGKVIRDIENELNVSVEDLLSGKKLLRARVSIESISGNGDTSYWAQAVIDEEDIANAIIDNPDYEG